MQNYSEFTAEGQKIIQEESGYSAEQLKEEDPLLVPELEFEEHAQELFHDIGEVGDNQAWPIYCIDWEYAARELKMDYTSFKIAGILYWMRAW